MMPFYCIVNATSDVWLGSCEAATAYNALNIIARRAGYANWIQARQYGGIAATDDVAAYSCLPRHVEIIESEQ